MLGGHVVPLSDGAEPTLLCSLGTKGARSSACPLGQRGVAMGSQIRPLSPGAPRSPTVGVPWKPVPHQPGHLPPGWPWVTASCRLLSGPRASRSLDVQLRRESAAASRSEGQRGDDFSPVPGAQLAPFCPWPEPLSLPSTLQATIQTRTARTTGWRLRTSGIRLGALSTAPPKVSQRGLASWGLGRPRMQQPGRAAGAGCGVLAGGGPCPQHLQSRGREVWGGVGLSLGTPAARTAQAGPHRAAGAGVRLQSVGVPRGDCSLAPTVRAFAP